MTHSHDGGGGFAGGMMGALLAIILVVVLVLAVVVFWQPWATGDDNGALDVDVDVDGPTPTNSRFAPMDYGLAG